MTSYKRLRTDFMSLFRACDRYVAKHPDAKLEYDEMSEEDPTLGFKRKKDNLIINVTFTLVRK